MKHSISLHKTLRTALATALVAFGCYAQAASYHTFATRSALAEGHWVKVALAADADGLVNDGIYQITYDQLKAMGFSNPANVGIYGQGGHVIPEALNLATHDDLEQVAVWHDEARRRILFYGQGLVTWEYHTSTRSFRHRQNAYSTEAYYFLHEDDQPSRAMLTLDDDIQADDEVRSYYDERRLHEVDETNLGETGREMYGEDFSGSNKSLNLNMGSFKANATLRVTMNFISRCEVQDSVRLTLGSDASFMATIPNCTNDYAFATEATIDRTFANSATGDITARITYLPVAEKTYSNCRLNYLRLQGPRDFVRPAQCLLFRSLDMRFQRIRYDLTAAMADGMQVWDVTDCHDVRRQLLTDNHFAAPSSGQIREYALVNTQAASFPSVYVKEVVANQDLHGLVMPDMVIVTATDYQAEAERLAAFRRTNDGLTVHVVTTKQVYNEFGSGIGDVSSIRLLMKMFYDRWKGVATRAEADTVAREPRYLLLVGDGYYDNHSITPERHIVAYETESSLLETSSCTCDDFFGFLDDGEGGKTDSNGRYTISSDGLDIGIGRLPVSSAEEARDVVSKIINYSQNKYFGPWKNRLTFLSDDDKEGDTPNCHVSHNDNMVALLEQLGRKEYVFQKVYLPAFTQTRTSAGTDYPDARKQFQEALKQGTLLVNYAGHGNNTAITNENMMTCSAARQLNMKYLPLWVTASCDVSRWDGATTSMGEELLLNPNGGAIALISTTRVVYASQNKTLNTALLRNLFSRFGDGHRTRLGDVMKASKLALGNDYNKLNFCLLGDPSTTLAYPEYSMELTSLTTKDGTFDLQANPEVIVPLKALTEVTVEGRVLELSDKTETCTSFNGLLYPTFYDSCDTLRADIGFNQKEGYTFASRGSKVFVGRSIIENGVFKFSFIVPQDVAYRMSTGLANLYACSDDGREAQGFFDRYTLTGDATYERTDTLGPEVRELFLDDASFTDGSTVGSTPYFYAEVYDESGFNATGNTVGHDVVLTLRRLDDPQKAPILYILNNNFTTLTGDNHRGNVQYSIPTLEDGTYEATFRIWDVFNNASSKTFSFNVQGTRAPEPVVVQAYPCPARSGDTVTFRVLHNRPESATKLTLQLFTQTGRMVYETTQENSSAQKVYTTDVRIPANTDINADESGDFLGSSQIVYTGKLLPGFYLYRVYISSGGSSEASSSHLLMVNP